MAEDERFFSRQIYLVVEISEFRSAKYFKCFESFLFIFPRSRSFALFHPPFIAVMVERCGEREGGRGRERTRKRRIKRSACESRRMHYMSSDRLKLCRVKLAKVTSRYQSWEDFIGAMRFTYNPTRFFSPIH